jgi:hypothetical protein
MSREKIS